MVLKLEAKKTVVAEVASVANQALSLVAAEYIGLSVNRFTALRKIARESKVYLRVVRNTLAHRAVEGTPYACAQSILSGPLVLAFSLETPKAAPLLIKNFMKENAQLKVKALAIDHQLLLADCLDELASLPTREEAAAQLASIMLMPVAYLARTLAELYGSFVRVMGAVMQLKKQADLTSNLDVECLEMTAIVSEKVKAIVKEISDLSALEIKTLVKEVEEVFGVSAAPMVAMGAMPVAGGGQEAAKVEEKTEFAVHLVKAGESKLSVTKVIREVTSLALLEAKKFVESAPVVVKEALSKAEAEELKKKLEAAGAEVEIK